MLRLLTLRNTAYYFLQAGEYEAPSSRVRTTRTETDDEFLASLVPSFLNFDYQGRVIRIDTFSSKHARLWGETTDLRLTAISNSQRPFVLDHALAGLLRHR